jgi:3-hydroxyacyl-[acyl-carrier-protein] dehydratase
MRWFWIDRFTQFVSSQRATAVKCVSLGEDHLHDHMPGFPIMPNSLVTEGMAQAGGLLVSEHYGFQELVVLGKISRTRFYGHVRPGQILTYRIETDTLRDDGAAVTATAHVGDKLHAEAQLFFARIGEANQESNDRQLFHKRDLLHWLSLVGVFEVGVRPDGSRLRLADYPLADYPRVDYPRADSSREGPSNDKEIPCAGAS